MNTWTAQARRELAPEWFGDPERKLYPCLSQGDLDEAARLIGKAKRSAEVKRRLVSISHRLGLTPPAGWMSDVGMGTIRFGAAPLSEVSRADNGMVVRAGLLCKAGEYPAHNFSLSPDDIRRAVANFRPGYVEMEHFTSTHQRSMLDGECGELRGVWASDDGTELYGDVALPEWLDTLSGKFGQKVSAVWSASDKSLKGVGMVLDPQVPEAALMSAVTALGKRHDTPNGQIAVQSLHDTSARFGAVCNAGNTGLASKHEAGAIQTMHDIAVGHGATCEKVGGRGNVMYSRSKGARMTVMDQFSEWYKAGKKNRDLAREAGADVGEEVLFSTVQGEAEIARDAARTEELASLKAERDEAKRERDEAQRERNLALFARVEAEGTGYVDGLITGNLVLPRERESLIAMYRQAAIDDSQGLVTLSGGERTSRVEQFKLTQSHRAPLQLTGEKIKINPDGSTVLMGKDEGTEEDPEKMDPEKYTRLLSFTAAGKTALANRLSSASGK